MSNNDVILNLGDADGNNASESTPLTPSGFQRRPSLTRRSSVTDLTSFLPTSVANSVPFLPSRSGSNVLQETFFCHICFMNTPINEGFALRCCGHMFCRECIKGYFENRINDGQVFLKCFHPPQVLPSMNATQTAKQEQLLTEMKSNENNNNNDNSNDNSNDNNNAGGTDGGDGNNENDGGGGNGGGGRNTFTQTCHEPIDELDIKAVVDKSNWEKYERFKTNIENPNARQCPFCEHTQFGSKDNPIMKCDNCGEQYCFFHSNAHDPEEPCESYDARMIKENKLNEARINERAKRCPGCNYPIEKISGCNHMKCIKCGTSFCWICEQIIEDAPVPSHYKDPDSPCHGKQFEGAGNETPPMWIIVVLAFYAILFGLPTLAISIVLGLVFWPIAYCCQWCVPEQRILVNDNARPYPKDVIGGCWFIWMLLFLIILLIPICIIACLYRILLLIPPFSWCLPNCFEVEDETAAQERRNAANPLGYEGDTAE